jgi:hypothetical protein
MSGMKMDSRDKIEKIIAESVKKQAEQQKEFLIFGKLLYITHPFLQPIDVQSVIDTVESEMPPHLFFEIDTVMVGQFDFLADRALEALYKDGAIYITNDLTTEKDLLENLIHEASHSLEPALGHYIYGDQKLKAEFLAKRERLYVDLRSHGAKNLPAQAFADTEYDIKFDGFLYKKLGYATLESHINGLFISPYSVTSLREYWATGFEEYFLGDREYLKKISPKLYEKIKGVVQSDD